MKPSASHVQGELQASGSSETLASHFRHVYHEASVCTPDRPRQQHEPMTSAKSQTISDNRVFCSGSPFLLTISLLWQSAICLCTGQHTTPQERDVTTAPIYDPHPREPHSFKGMISEALGLRCVVRRESDVSYEYIDSVFRVGRKLLHNLYASGHNGQLKHLDRRFESHLTQGCLSAFILVSCRPAKLAALR